MSRSRCFALALTVVASLACTEPPAEGPVTDTQAGPDPAVLIAAMEAPRAAEATDFDPGYGDHAARHAALTLEQLLGDTGVPGLSIAVFQDEEILWAHSWGTADRETGVAVTPDTLFQAASISKPTAAMAFMKAQEQGLFGLDQPINEILRSWQLPDNDWTAQQPVTPRRLMSHTAGTTVHGFPGYEADATVPSVVEVLTGRGNTDAVLVDALPGTISRYSGGGTTILQLALADATGRPFPEILSEWVLTPAGMRASAYEQPPDSSGPERARAHRRPGLADAEPGTAAEREASPWHVYPELAAAGLWTTPTDLALLAIDVQKARRGETDRVVTPETARRMTTLVGVGSYGLGWNLQDRGTDADEVWYFSHSGGNWGFRCNLMAHLDDGYGAVVMINGDNFDLIVEVQKRIALAHGWAGEILQPPRNWELEG